MALTHGHAAAQTPTGDVQYLLAPGDRLEYREEFEREGKSQDTTFRTRFVFSNQVVVLDADAGRWLAGVQRNRQSADVLEYHERGKDTLSQQSPRFAQRLAERPARFADANLFSSSGHTLLPVQVAREAYSKLLYRIDEIMPIGPNALRPQTKWDVGSVGVRMRLDRFETLSGESCAVFSDTGTRKDAHLQMTFCPRSGHLAKLEYEGQYQEFGTTINEKVTLELTGVHHQESPAQWLADSNAQLGALTAYLEYLAPLPPDDMMDGLFKNGPSAAQALALAAYYQRGLKPKSDLLQPLLQSNDAEVRRLANRIASPPAKPESQPCELPAVRRDRQKPGTTLRGMSTAGFENDVYVMHVPLDYRGDQSFPLIVYLGGGAGLALDAALRSANTLMHSGYLMVIPQAGSEYWWQSKPTEMVHALLLEVLRSYNVDTNRTYLTGFSNGGTGALEYAVRWPDRLAAVASLMGAGLNTPSEVKLPLQNLSNVPMLLLHGDKDTIIPSDATTRTYDELRGLKPRIPPELHILKGHGHDITLDSDEGYTLPFFERFAREPFPRTVTAKVFDARYPRQYWMELVEGESGTAEMQGRISEGNVIEIKTRNVKKLRILLRPELLADSGPIRVRLNSKELQPIELRRDCQLFRRSAQDYTDPFLAFTDEVMLEVGK